MEATPDHDVQGRPWKTAPPTYVYDRTGYFALEPILADDAEPVEVKLDITGSGIVIITVRMEGTAERTPIVKPQVIRRFKTGKV